MAVLPVLSPRDAATWDADAEGAGIQPATLMECAGRAAAHVLASRFRQALAHGVVVAAGTGNNGGDGWVLARALHRVGTAVWVAQLPGEPSALQRQMASLARAEGVRLVDPEGPWPGVGVAVDAILGTGARGAPRGPAAALAARLQDLGVPVVALDGPTGVDLERGTTHGAAGADLSITFGGLRRGHALARDQVGDIVVVDIGHPPARPQWPVAMTDTLATTLLPRLAADAHKGTRGRVVVVGGAEGMTGALRMAGRAAFAAGAGLVHVVAPEPSILAVRHADPDLQSSVQDLEQPPSEAVLRLVSEADAVVAGPGMGRTPGRLEFLSRLLDAVSVAVIDADALVILSSTVATLERRFRERRIVLTPHPGEFRTLFPDLAAAMEVDPWGAAEQAARTTGATVLLKGVPSVVATPGMPTHTILAGNPGLATGGSGDVLAGFIGTFLGQGLSTGQAAALGGQLLGRAADLAARRHSARGLRPVDVLAAVPDVYRGWSRPGVPRTTAPVLFELDRPEQV